MTLFLNGQETKASILHTDETLLTFLRERAGLTGTKKACGEGHCGSCTVIVDGSARRSCMVRLNRLQGARVETIEGLGQNGQLHPIQKAFLHTGAVQCGFCTPGMIMAAKALLDRTGHPSERQIKNALKNNICRCTGYGRVVDAVQLAARWLEQPDQEEHILLEGGVGDSIADIEGGAKVAGALLFADDYRQEKFLAGKILWSAHPHAKLLSIHTERAKDMAGVKAVIAASDIPGRNGIGFTRTDQPVLVVDRVRTTGDAVAAVFAETGEEAEEACKAIEVEYEVLPVVSSPETALDPQAPHLHPEGNVLEQFEYGIGDVDAALSGSRLIVSGRFDTPFVEHAYLETESAWAKTEKDGSLTLYTCTQYPFEVRKQLSEILRLEESRIRVVVTPIGGAFGGKTDMNVCIPIAALGALKTRRPVKVTLERGESIRSSTKRHAFTMDYSVGLDREGRISAVDANLFMDAGPYTGQSEWVLEQACIFACGPYRVPDLRVRGKGVYTNNAKGGAFRGFGINQVAFGLESLLDEAARKLNIDPLELRIRNVFRKNDRTPAGERLVGTVGARATLEAAKEIYAKLRSRDPSQKGWKRGIGIATAYKNVGLGRGAADNGSAFMRLENNGRLTVVTSAPDMGQGIRTGLYQIIQQVLGVKRHMVDMRLSDTDTVAPSHGGAGERLTFCTGNAVLMAATRLREEVLAAVERIWGFRAGDLDAMTDGILRYCSNGIPVSIALQDVASRLERETGVPLEIHEAYNAPRTYNLGDRGKVNEADYRLYPAYSYTTAIAVVEVEEAGHGIEVKDLYIFQDVGKPINPQIIAGQLEGSCLQALGYALKEDYRLKDGVPLSMTFKALGVPTIMDVPRYHSFLIETADPHGPFGAKGISEVAMIPTTPAIVNAIRDATGIRLYSLPVTNEKIEAERKRAAGNPVEDTTQTA